MLVGRLPNPELELPLLQDLHKCTQLGSVCQILREVLHMQADALEVLVHPVLERVGLDVHPDVFVAFDLHALGGVALGRARLHADLREAELVGRHADGGTSTPLRERQGLGSYD
jgi:hypothetical protein